MKLLFYIHGLTGGGAERVMATLMNGFVEQGHLIRVIYTECMDYSVYPLNSKIEQVYMLKGLPVKSNSLLGKIIRKLWKYPAIRKQAKMYHPDYVISFIKTQNNDVLAALLGTGFPIIIGDHTNVDRKYRWLTKTLSNILYPTARAITMLTMRDYNKWKYKYKNVYYMPNPCDIKQKHVGETRKKVVLAVGRVNQWDIKGFDILIEAWSQICEKYPDWKCQIAGAYSDERLKDLREKVGDVPFNTVEFIGFRLDIHDYMESCEVFCLSSRIEGMPMVLLEAMNLGCACVAFDCTTGPAEIIIDGETGFLVNNQDKNDLIQKLECIISNAELRKCFREKAPQSLKRYSTDMILSMWNNMFNELNS